MVLRPWGCLGVAVRWAQIAEILSDLLADLLAVMAVEHRNLVIALLRCNHKHVLTLLYILIHPISCDMLVNFSAPFFLSTHLRRFRPGTFAPGLRVAPGPACAWRSKLSPARTKALSSSRCPRIAWESQRESHWTLTSSLPPSLCGNGRARLGTQPHQTLELWTSKEAKMLDKAGLESQVESLSRSFKSLTSVSFTKNRPASEYPNSFWVLHYGHTNPCSALPNPINPV